MLFCYRSKNTFAVNNLVVKKILKRESRKMFIIVDGNEVIISAVYIIQEKNNTRKWETNEQ